MAKKSKQPNLFTGRWRIVSMEQWDQDYIDEEEQGYIEFDDKGMGSFHFGYVHGNMDCQLTTRVRSQPSNGPGMAMTKWMQPRGVAGPS